jgi:hypothetical protein
VVATARIQYREKEDRQAVNYGEMRIASSAEGFGKEELKRGQGRPVAAEMEITWQG